MPDCGPLGETLLEASERAIVDAFFLKTRRRVCRIHFYLRYSFSILGSLRYKSLHVSFHTQQNYSPSYVRRVRMVQRLSQRLTVRKFHVVAVGITRKTWRKFQKEAISDKDPSLKEFASKTLPTLQSHLQQAREMQRTVQACSEN